MFSKRIKSENCLLSTLLSRIVIFGACLFVFISPLTVCAQSGFDFSKVAPTGQRLYYYIEGSNNVVVTYPLDVDEDDDDFDNDYWGDYTVPSGSMTIPSTVTNNGVTYTVTGIDGHTFQGCSGLTSVVIPHSVESIGLVAFGNCGNLSSVSFNADSCLGAYRAFEDCANLVLFSFGSNVKVVPYGLCAYLTRLNSVSLPNSVTIVGGSAFKECTGLSFVNLGNSVCTIGNEAFKGCTNLSYVPLPNTLSSIGDGAFYNCYRLASMTLPSSLSTIGNESFRNCSSITSMHIPDQVSSIGDYTFGGCSNMDTITLSNALQSIGVHAFSGCYNLKMAELPKTLKSIGNYAFYECSSLVSVTIPDSVSIVGIYGFCGCRNLESVSIGKSILYVYDHAFEGCTNIGNVFSLATIPPGIGVDAFKNVPTNANLFVPCEAKSLYEISLWNSFTNICGLGCPATIEISSADATMGTASVNQAGSYSIGDTITLIATAFNGYSFSHWNDGDTNNPRSVVITQDSSFVAFFIPFDGIDDVFEDDALFYQSGNAIVINSSINESVTIYDIMGKLILSTKEVGNKTEIRIPSSGVYLVKIGNHPARKVVVLVR